MDLLDQRKQLDASLQQIAGEHSGHVYFQPPSNVQMTYPAIRYRLMDIDSRHADNIPYILGTQYEIIVIDRDPDSVIAGKVTSLPRCSFNRFYTAENLNHWVFTIY